MTDERENLEHALAVRFGDADISELTRLTGGASRETWRCRIGAEAVVVQRQRTGAERDMAIEAAVLVAAAHVGVRVPRLMAYEPDLAGASTLITVAVAGETIARRILRDEQFAAARDVLPADLGRALARIHAIDPVDVPGLEFRDPVAVCRETLDRHGQPHPAFELALRWLEEHRPATTRTTVVHGDFRLGNVIVDERGLGAVIDWELVHLGDPVEDLGWLCVPAWRFGSPWPAAGVGTRTAVLDAYEEESGVRIDLDVLRWWEVVGILMWGTICITQSETHRSGTFRSHELAAIGRRVCENELDLFRALEGRW
jgi:aminoglycoside phosphotransferase (APT) family kinase protein